MAAIEVRGLEKVYDGEVHALNGVDLTVAKNSITALLGPNGAGKTTLLLHLIGILEPGEGAIRVEGIDLAPDTLREVRRRIGMVFQNYALFPHMSVEQNVAFGLKYRDVPKETIKEKVTRALEMVRLPGVENRMPSQLSGGQQQRIAMARAIVIEPDVLLMDEPFSALDALTRIKLQDLSAELTRGTTTVLVTHDAAEALRMAHRIIILGGSPAQVKTTIDFHTRPPRSPDSSEVLEHYGRLLGLLLEDHH